MRIALDCRSVFPGMGGIGRYTESLAKSLANHDSDNQYVFLTTDRQQKPISSNKEVTQLDFEAGMIDSRWEQLQLPSVLSENDIDLYHNTCFSLPVVKTANWMISTVHDVVFRAQPKLVDDHLRDYLDRWTEYALNAANAVITVSEFSKQQIINFYDADSDKIHVIYNAMDKAFKPATKARQNSVLKKYHLPKQFLLYLGSIEPKKNIDGLLDAIKLLPDKTKLPCPLVLAGGRGGKQFDLDTAIKSRKITDQVISVGYVDDKDITPLLSAATIFIYPSFYEGFGLPPLEAMACGTATIVSNTTSLPEVVGNGAFVTDANDAEELAVNIASLLDNPDLRKQLERQGKERAKQFSWETTAKQTLDIYQNLAPANYEKKS